MHQSCWKVFFVVCGWLATTTAAMSLPIRCSHTVRWFVIGSALVNHDGALPRPQV